MTEKLDQYFLQNVNSGIIPNGNIANGYQYLKVGHDDFP